MTAIAEIGSRPVWRRRLVWIALALSVTLNVCVIGGWVWTMMEERRTPAERFFDFGRQLDLKGDQNAAFKQFGHTVHRHSRLLQETNGPLLRQVWQELAKPVPDQTVVAGLVEKATQNRLAYQKEIAATLNTFLNALSPPQRAHFADLASHRSDQISRRLWQMIAP